MTKGVVSVGVHAATMELAEDNNARDDSDLDEFLCKLPPRDGRR